MTRGGRKALVALHDGSGRYIGEQESRIERSQRRLAASAAVNGLNSYLESRSETFAEKRIRLLEVGDFRLSSGEAAVYVSLELVEGEKKKQLLGAARSESQGLYAAAAAVLDAANRKIGFSLIDPEAETTSISPGERAPSQQLISETKHGLGLHLASDIVRATLLDPQGKMTAQATRPCLPTALPETVLHQALAALQEVQAGDGSAAQICGIGIALAGRHRDGVCLESPEFPGWSEVSLVELAGEHLKQPVLLIEETKAALAAEALLGAGVGLSNLLYFSSGGRLSCAAMLEGKVLEGASGAFATAAHLTLPDYTADNEEEDPFLCGCGRSSCWQSVASDSALVEITKAKIARGQKSAVLESAGGKPESLTLGLLIEAAEAGDPLAHEVMKEGAFWVGQALIGLMELYDPEAVVVSGPALPDEMWMAHLRESLMSRPAGRRCPLLVAKLGRDGPILGAALLAREISP